MMMKELLLVFLLCFGVRWDVVTAQFKPANSPIQEALFHQIDEYSFPCSVLYTTDGAVGCTTLKEHNPARGDLFQLSSIGQISSLCSSSNQKQQAHAILIKSSLLFNALKEIQGNNCSSYISMIFVNPADDDLSLILENESPKSAFNENGNSLIRKYMTIPMTFLSQDDGKFLSQVALNLAEKPASNPTHAADYKFYMGPSSGVNSSYCLSINRCSPVGGLSVWGTLGTYPKVDKKIVLATAAMDSVALFHDLAFGANSAASGIVTILAAAHALSSFKANISAFENHLMFALFKGESQDRMGSLGFLRDIASGCQNISSKNSCVDPPIHNLEWTKLRLANIDKVIVVDQVLSEQSSLFARASTGTLANSSSLLDIVSNISLPFTNMNVLDSSATIPEESILESFQRNVDWLGNATHGGVGVLLSGYNDSFPSSYRSFMDVLRSEQDILKAIESVKNASQILARVMIKAAKPVDGDAFNYDSVVVDSSIVESLVRCFMENFACKLVADHLGISIDELKNVIRNYQFTKNAYPEGQEVQGPVSLFSGIYRAFILQRGQSPGLVEVFIRNFLAAQVGFFQQSPIVSCNSDFDCANQTQTVSCLENLQGTSKSSIACIRKVCGCSTAQYHDTLSPGIKLELKNKQFEFVVVNASQPLWTEPFWESPSIKIYEKTNNVASGIALGVSIVLILITAIVSQRLPQTFI